MKAALICPESLDTSNSTALVATLAELGIECVLCSVTSADETEAALRERRPDIVLVPTGDAPAQLLPLLSEIAYTADYVSGRVALFGETAERSPELFLSESEGVIIHHDVAFVAARLAALPSWNAESLRHLGGLVFKENGRLVRV